MLNECFNCHLESLLAHILSKKFMKKMLQIAHLLSLLLELGQC